MYLGPFELQASIGFEVFDRDEKRIYYGNALRQATADLSNDPGYHLAGFAEREKHLVNHLLG